MAGRPAKTTADWFPHDTRAGQGKTLSILFNKFGHEGLSAWWLLLELISASNNAFIVCNNSNDWEFLASQLKLPLEKTRNILACLAELGAIESDLWHSDIIFSQNLVDRLEPLYARRKQQKPQKPIPANNNSIIAYINTLIAHLSPSEIQQITLDKITLDKSTPPTTTPDAPAQIEVPPVPLGDTSKLDPVLATIATAYELNIGSIGPMIADDLKHLKDTYNPDWIIDSFKICVQHQKHNLAYATRILERWKLEGKDDGYGKGKVPPKGKGENHGQGFNKSGIPANIGEWDTGEVREVPG